MKKLKFTRLAASLAFAFVGYTFAADNLPSVPYGNTYSIRNYTDWETLRTSIKLMTGDYIVVKFMGDVQLIAPDSSSNLLGAPIDVEGKNVYVVGESYSKTTLSGLEIDASTVPSLFTNVGDSLYIGDMEFKNCFLHAKVEGDEFSAGFFADSVKYVFMKNVALNNVSVSAQYENATFNDVGFVTGYAGSVTASNLKVDGLNVNHIPAVNVGGLFGSVEKDFVLENASVKNISFSPTYSAESKNFGGLVGVAGVDGKLSNFSITGSNIGIVDSLANVKVGHTDDVFVGGLAGRVFSNAVTLNQDTLSGKVTLAAKAQSETDVSNGFFIGGAIGSWETSVTTVSLFQASQTVFNTDVNVDLLNVKTTALVHNLDDYAPVAKSAIGGAVGKISAKAPAYFMTTSANGDMTLSSSRAAFPAIGGLVGLATLADIEFQNITADSSSIKVTGSYASVGGLLGLAQQSEKLIVKNVASKKNMDMYLQKDYEDGSLGGIIGAVQETPTQLSSISIDAYLNFKGYLSKVNDGIDKNMAVGGVVGAIWKSDSLNASQVKFNGFIYTDLFALTKEAEGAHSNAYVGGLIGHSAFTNLKISSSSVVGAKNDSIASVKLQQDNYKRVAVGGFIGFAQGNTAEKVSITESYVQGHMATAAESVDELSYASGFIGLLEKGSSLTLTDFFYRGTIAATRNSTSGDEFEVSGLFFLGQTKDTSIVKRGYVYDMFNKSASSVESLPAAFVTEKNEDVVFSQVYVFNDPRVIIADINGLPASPAFAYSLNVDNANVWTFNPSANDGLPMLISTIAKDSESSALAPKKVSIKDYETASGTMTYDIYSDNTGLWGYKPEGVLYETSSVVYDNSMRYNDSENKMAFWKVAGSEIIWKGFGKTELADGQVFVKYESGVPTPTFVLDSNASYGRPIIFWDGEDYSIAKNDTLPYAVFMVKDNNGDSSYYKGNVWKIAGTDKNVTNSADLYEYIVCRPNTADEVKLEFNSEESLKDGVKFQTKIRSINATSMTLNYRSMGVEKEVTFLPEIVLLPKIDRLSIEGVGNDSATSSFVVSVGDVALDSSAVLGQKFDFSGYETLDMVTIYQNHYAFKPEDPAGNDSTQTQPVPGDSTGKDSGEVVVPRDTIPVVIDRTPECPDSSYISAVKFETSGSAALFGFKLNIPSFCKKMEPKVTVEGPDGYVLDSTLASKTKAYEFALYPLDPGDYTFKVKLTSKKSKTIKKSFASEISVVGRRWNLVALGSWPKDALKGESAKIYAWNPDVAIGDFWQYEAFPKASEAVATTGYWVKSEKNLKFSLEVPLKKADGDSLKWNLKKKYNGWNMLANPYSWNLYAGSVAGFKSAENGDAPFWVWNADSVRYEIADTLFANTAFWINTDKNRTLRVSSAPVFPNNVAAKSSKKALKKASAESWSMVLVASDANGASDCWNVLGVGSRNIDISEPPVMESSLSVSFIGDDNSKLAKRILAKSSSEEMSWKVGVNASQSNSVKLSLEGLDEVRAMGYRAVFVMDGESYEWGDESSITVKTSGNKTGYLKVVPATAKVVAAKGIADMNFSVLAGKVDVQFSLASEMAGLNTAVRLLDMNGKVITNMRGVSQAGTNSFSIGAPARKGVYVLQIQVGKDSRSVRVAF